MFIPEYSITPKILASIAVIEYSKAIIDTTTILPSWERQLQKDARIKTIYAGNQLSNINTPYDSVKQNIEGTSMDPSIQILNFKKALDLMDEMEIRKDVEETDLNYIHQVLTEKILPRIKQGSVRAHYADNKVNPEEILAHMVQIFEWVNSLEAKESHPIIVAAIMNAAIEMIQPYELYNTVVANLTAQLLLNIRGYRFKGFTSVPDCNNKSKKEYDQKINSLDALNPDFTAWIEFFADNVALEVSNLQEKIKLLAKDTKVAKAAGRNKLTSRQERIVEHLQDYGILQNKDFSRIFPDVSEDSVLRDMKKLIEMNIIKKTGSTKSSRYELA